MSGEEQAFFTLKRRILLDRGLDCEQYKEAYLKRRIGVRLRATGAGGYLDYVRILRRDPEEYAMLLNELTINVTQFFRDPDVYGRLADFVIPELLESKKSAGRRSIRVWSAGCASGEEPYSVAILLAEALGTEGGDWNVRITGSDLDDGSLEAAKAARYEKVEMPDGIATEGYFEVERPGNGTGYRVIEEVRRRVKFERENLLDARERRHFDLVLCRNVLIYFAREVQSRVVRSLAASMQKDGFLVLGKSETLGLEAGRMFTPVFPRERIYKLAAAPRGGPAEGRDGKSF